jgi:Flp pilus assembly pilin Flp
LRLLCTGLINSAGLSLFDAHFFKGSIMNIRTVRNIRALGARAKQAGQGMTEYIIIVALIAVAAIAVTQLFGATIRNQMAGIAKEVSGNDGTAAINQAGTASTKAATAAADTSKNSLSTFGDQKTAGTQ